MVFSVCVFFVCIIGIALASLLSYARCTDEALLELGRAILRIRRFADHAPDDVDVARLSYAVDGTLKYGVLERGHLREVFMYRHDGCRQNFAVTVFRVVSQTVWYGVGAAGGGRFHMVSGGCMRVPVVCPDHGVIGAREYVCPGLVVGNFGCPVLPSRAQCSTVSRGQGKCLRRGHV
ncbi:hypothetical protein QAD02_003021 [Eretmocerus hayati]|uniref:Uncharacterized protein n=1 Tax=Eretmocerus hayati TaxID=131215 RepID=A0ACC2NKY7_9HYME|nr:hypothetical protein QAD02_003021 [Eretmocerus hayati]